MAAEVWMRPWASVSGSAGRDARRSQTGVAIGAFALDAENDLLESAQLGRRHVEHFDLPALVFGVAPVHLVEVAGEEGGLFAAGAGEISMM